MWSIKQCVCHDQCAPGPWAKANVWSLVHPDKCLQYLKQHLIISGKHAMLASEAQIEIQTKFNEIEFVVSTDTFADRQWYREQRAAVQECTKKRKRAGGAGGGNDGAAAGAATGSNDAAAASVDINQAIQVAISRGIAPALRSALSNLGHSDDREDVQLTFMGLEPAVPSHAVGNRITVSTEVLKTLRENARRSEDALKGPVGSQ